MDEVMIHSGMAELVPCSQRGRAPFLLGLVLLLMGLAGLWGLLPGGVLLCLVAAVTIEAVSYRRRWLCPLPVALARPSVWDRMRPPFYWTLIVSSGLLGLLTGATLLTSLLRAGFLWLCFRAIEDSVSHPERYKSVGHWTDWLKRLGQHAARAWGHWYDLVILGITASFVLNLGAPGIWASVGNADWGRLLLFAGGVYALATLAFTRAAGSTVGSAVHETVRACDGAQADDLSRALRLSRLTPDPANARLGYTAQIAEQLRWKRVDNLVARVGVNLESTLARRLRWSAFLANGLAFLLAFLFLAVSAFLIIPREVMIGWVSAGQAGTREVALAFDLFEELYNLTFEDRVSGLDPSDLAKEPLPKVVFLEAALLASLLLLRTVPDRAALQSMADAHAENVQRWLLLGTAYLTLREKEFQYLHSGVVTRQLTGDKPFRTLTLRNEILLAPSLTTKAAVYRAISDFVRLYAAPAWRSSAYLVAVFASYRFAQAWALRFVRSTVAMEVPPDREPDVLPGKFWIWSGEQLLDLGSLEEAQWYGRFEALEPDYRLKR